MLEIENYRFTSEDKLIESSPSYDMLSEIDYQQNFMYVGAGHRSKGRDYFL